MLRTLSFAVFCALWTTAFTQSNRQPRFTNADAVRDFFQRGIKENLPVSNQPVIRLTCEDPDGNLIQYQAVRTSSVRIDSSNGDIYFTRPLDYEQSVNSNNELEKANSVTFQCQDYDSDFIPLSDPATLAITITVIDVNDNFPAFSVESPDGYTLQISEDAAVGTTLRPLLSVFDADQGPNAKMESVQFQCGNTPEEQEGCQTFDVSFVRNTEQNYTVSISLKRQLDYETRTFYKLGLQAVDGEGTPEIPHLTSSVGVRIVVEDSQDTNPLFTNQNLNFVIYEGLAVGADAAFTVSARDGDLGARRPILIEIVEDGVDLFEAKPSLIADVERGIYAAGLRVRTEIDRESPDLGATYQFTARATELDSNGTRTQATATAQFTARILDIDDNGPEFAQANYRVEVQEMDGMTGIVQIPNLKIDVTDPDEPSFARFKVDVSSQSNAGAFGLTPDEITTGAASFYLTVNNFVHFDYDDPTYRTQIVQLRAVEIEENNLPGTKSSSATVTVVLTDINDNPPVFSRTEYVGSVVENAVRDTSILTIQATDRDEGVNGELVYSIADRVTDRFAIDPVSGVIRLIGTLDYESQNSYSFLAFAEDKSDKPITSQVQVQISVVDFNDIGPQFTLPTYRGVVSEDSLDFESPVIVEAIDPADSDARITYSIAAGNTPSNSFVMDTDSGELTLREKLDFEAIPNGTDFYVLDVEASDNGSPALTATTKITITVLDENDHTPQFVVKQYFETISEAILAGTSLLTLSAEDGDAGSNGQITYRIGSGARDNFVLNSNGVLSISNNPSFDYDAVQTYTLEIFATDGGSPQRSDTASVTITVTDANNKNPSFGRNLYTAIVAESTSIGTSVLQVSATDPDSQFRLQYSIDRPSITAINRGGAQVGSTFPYDYRALFGIDQASGVISVQGTLDRDYVVEVSFVIKVEDVDDSAIGTQTGTSRVTITISGTLNTDLYFNPPWTRDNPRYEVGILESVPVNTEIITLQARDPVTGGRVISNYQEVSEPEGGDFFRIGQTSGIVYLNGALDYEEGVLVRSVVVRAVQDTRSVTATVQITVEDENDESPRFTQPEYRFRVSESAEYPYKVGVISAFDPDSSTYGPIRYTLRGLGAGNFTVFDSITGNSAEILVKDKLDYEKIPEYDLDIYARDNANNADAPSNQARARVVISIIDENDNTPEFAEDVRKFSVAETAPPSTRLGQVLAKDGDFGLNGVIVYRLTQDPDRPDSNALNLFSVTSSSAIVVTQASLRGLSGIYYMTLVATDQGSPPNSASIPIEVKVQGAEDDDGTPQWLEPINNYVVEIYEHEPNTSLPVNLRAQPRTENATAIYEFSYFRNESVHFRINRSSGEIIVVDDLDREVKENYTLVVMAKDSKNTTLFSRRTILVRLLDKDDNDPLFKKNYAACPSDLAVPTIEYADDNTPNGTVITRAVACDPDSPRFSMMYYSLYLDNAICQEENVNAFIVTPDGYIVANKMLDYEERTEYLVCVEVSASAPVNRRRKRSLDPFRMVPNDTVGYFVIRIRDVNDQGPEFDKDNVVAVLQTIPSSNVVTKVTAIDRDGPLHNSVLYRIAETMYHPGDGSQPYSLDTAFRINPNNGIVSTNLPSYEDFADGYFMLRIVAQDYELSSLNDAIWLKIIVYKRSQILRVVLDMQPGAGRLKAPELVRDLNSVDSRIQFYFLTASEHRTVNAPVGSQTDICFVMVQNSKAYEVNSGVGLLDSRYEAVLGRQEYELVDRGACFPLKPSADSLKWVDLWWVLVAIAIFIFICCVILLVTIIILYDRYKDYMTTQRTYMVPQ